MVAILGIVLPVGFTMLIGQLFAFLGKKLFPWLVLAQRRSAFQ